MARSRLTGTARLWAGCALATFACCGSAGSRTEDRLGTARAIALTAHEASGVARTEGYERAAALLTEHLQGQHEDAEALRWRAHCFTALDRPAEALADLDAALRIEPRHAWAQYARAMALHSLGRLDDALAGYGEALACAPDELVERKALQWRGFTRSRRGDQEAAIGDLTRALALEPRDTWTLVVRAKAYFAAGRIDDAEQDLYKAHEIDPSDAEAQAQLGYLRAVRGESAPALELLRKAVRNDPQAQAEARLWIALLEPEASAAVLAGLEDGWPGAVAAFLLGRADAAALRAAATREAEDRRVEVAFWIGARALREGRTADATRALVEARSFDAKDRWEWWLAERWLTQAR